MSNLTLLEKEVLSKILSSLGMDNAEIFQIIDSLRVSKKMFSEDAIDKKKCSGFFVNFRENSLLASLENVPHHLGVQLSHKSLPVGADFILFMNKSKTGIDFLEASFFDSVLPINQLQGEEHEFTIA
jgi:hypothetical protein